MVKGLDTFINHFREFPDHYILIGGSACDWLMTQKAIDFRVTKDLDIIVIVEALSDAFVDHFWQFIKNGNYEIAQVDNKKSFYRFIEPKKDGYPKMLELFARKPETFQSAPDFHLTDIPTSEEVSSLSAILMDDDYYNFTLANSSVSENLHHANDIALICLKARAFLNNKARKEEGQQVREEDIVKHKKDIIRLTAALDPATRVNLPDVIHKDIEAYIAVLQNENPDIKNLLKNQGMAGVNLSEIIEQLQATFGLI